MENKLIDMQYYGILKVVREAPDIANLKIREAMGNRRAITSKIQDLAAWGLIFETVHARNNRKTYVISSAGTEILDAMDSLYHVVLSKIETGELVIDG